MRSQFVPAVVGAFLLTVPVASPAFVDAPSAVAAGPAAASPFQHLPIAFEVNRGQTDRRVAFLARSPGATTFLTATGAVVAMAVRGNGPVVAEHGPGRPTASRTPSTRAIGLRYVGAALHPNIVGQMLLPGSVNSFHGNDPRRWHTNIPTYGRVAYHNVYPGIDLLYHGGSGRLESDWVLRAGARSSSIRIQAQGGTLALDARGNLLAQASGVSISEAKPIVYQDIAGRRHPVLGAFVLHGTFASFRLGHYDTRWPVVIDPTLLYSVDLGGTDGSRGLGIAVDLQSNAYVTGATQSSNFPTVHALQRIVRGDEDVFVAKLDPSGTHLLYSTYVGGRDNDIGIAIAVDRVGAAYITGETLSSDYPTVHAIQASNRSRCTLQGAPLPCDDVLITKVSPRGNSLVYSTYLGGNNGDEGYSIAVGRDGSAFVTGKTDSDNFPLAHPLQPHKGSDRCADATGIVSTCTDAFVSKLNPTGTALLFSTYLGGRLSDEGDGIAVDRRGNIYVAGTTFSSNFPRKRPLQAHRRGAYDAFVTEIDPSGGALVYSTYLGGSDEDSALGIAVHGGSAYVAGYTTSTDFPLARALRSAPEGLDAFVTRIAPGGSRLEYSTYLGGGGDDEALGIVVDRGGDAFVTGDTTSTDFLTVDAVQPVEGGGNDAFLTGLNPTGTALMVSTYLGGKNQDYGDAIALDSRGDAYITGFTFSVNFPTVHGLPGAVGNGAFIAKVTP